MENRIFLSSITSQVDIVLSVCASVHLCACRSICLYERLYLVNYVDKSCDNTRIALQYLQFSFRTNPSFFRRLFRMLVCMNA